MTYNQPEVLAAFYNKRANDDFIRRYQNVPFYFRARAFLEQTFQGGLRPFARLLDVGCGPGHLTANLLGSIQVVGIDLSPEMLAKAKAARAHGDYFEHDFHHPLPADVAPFDIIFASGAFDLCNDLGMAFASLAASLKEQGLFYFTIPEHRPGAPNNGERERIARPQEPDSQPVWLHFFSFQEVAEGLGKAGLAPVSYQYAEGYRSNSLGISFDYGYWIVVKKPLQGRRRNVLV